MKDTFARAFLAAACAALLWVPDAAAAVPPNLAVQGVLADATGAPRNGNFDITFRIYNVATAGAALWSETHASVPVARGLFNVTLGDMTSLATLTFDAQYYLGVQVGSDPEMTPRQRLSASPYARRAATAAASNVADVASALAPTAPVPANQITGTIADARLSSNVPLLSGGVLDLDVIPGGIDAASLQGRTPAAFAPAEGSNFYVQNRSTFDTAQSGSFNLAGSGKLGAQLDVGSNATIAGSVRLGFDPSSCDSTRAGTIRWNGSAFEGCNGSAWTPLGAPSVPGVFANATTSTEIRGTQGVMIPIAAVNVPITVTPGKFLVVEYSGPIVEIDPAPDGRRENRCRFWVQLYTSDGTPSHQTSIQEFAPYPSSTSFLVHVMGMMGPSAGGNFFVRVLFGSSFNSDFGTCRLQSGNQFRLYAKEL